MKYVRTPSDVTQYVIVEHKITGGIRTVLRTTKETALRIVGRWNACPQRTMGGKLVFQARPLGIQREAA
jgi:hypothetical protein